MRAGYAALSEIDATMAALHEARAALVAELHRHHRPTSMRGYAARNTYLATTSLPIKLVASRMPTPNTHSALNSAIRKVRSRHRSRRICRARSLTYRAVDMALSAVIVWKARSRCSASHWSR